MKNTLIEFSPLFTIMSIIPFGFMFGTIGILIQIAGLIGNIIVIVLLLKEKTW